MKNPNHIHTELIMTKCMFLSSTKIKYQYMRNSHSLAAFAFGQISTGSRIMSTNPYLQIKQRNEITF